MAQAWMVRSGQQQRLIEKLVRKFREMADRYEDQVGHGRTSFVCSFLAAYFRTISSPGTIGPVNEESTWSSFRRSIHEFSRMPEEEYVLCWRLFKEIAKWELGNPLEHALSRVEHTHPQQLFGASSSTDEVDLGQEDEED